MAVLVMWGATAGKLILLSKDFHLENLETGQVEIFSAAKDYYRETGAWPASVTVLANTPGYYHLKPYVPKIDGGWYPGLRSPWELRESNELILLNARHRRMAAITHTHTSIDSTSYLSANNNDCADADSPKGFDDAASWCPRGNSLQNEFMSTEVLFDVEMRAEKQYGRLADKVKALYSNTLSPINLSNPSLPLYQNITHLEYAPWAVADAFNCTGTFALNTIGVECGDLYNADGNPIYLENIGSGKFKIYSYSRTKDVNGNPLLISQTFNYA